MRLQGSEPCPLATMTLKARCHTPTPSKSNLRQVQGRLASHILSGCNTLITESTAGLPRPQLAGRANSTASTWRQRAGPKMCGSQSLRVSHVSARSLP
eukprot:2473258-Amphidinium_carterae.1